MIRIIDLKDHPKNKNVMRNNALLQKYLFQLKHKSVILSTKHRLVLSLREKLRDKNRNYTEYSQILAYLQLQEKKEQQIEKQWYAIKKKITELENSK
ncbi:Uncharacterised protein [uncultured archaeon]|nr:Uncharacterised protein [uncultured archaeon]